jgi:hypothetical protein
MSFFSKLGAWWRGRKIEQGIKKSVLTHDELHDPTNAANVLVTGLINEVKAGAVASVEHTVETTVIKTGNPLLDTLAQSAVETEVQKVAQK